MGQVSARNAEIAALMALQSGLGPAFLGFRFDRGLTGGVTVTRNGSPIGAWWFENGEYKFARIARQRAHLSAKTTQAVVSRTVAMVVHADGVHTSLQR